MKDQNESESEASDVSVHSAKVDQVELEKTRKEYASLKAHLMKFKREKVGTSLDVVQAEEKGVSALAVHRQKFLNAVKHTKMRENETMSLFNDFVSKVRQPTDTTWRSTQLKFHVDSEKAYDHTKASEAIARKRGQF